MIQDEEAKLIMEAAKQKGEDMRNSVDALRRHLTQQVNYHHPVSSYQLMGSHTGKP